MTVAIIKDAKIPQLRNEPFFSDGLGSAISSSGFNKISSNETSSASASFNAFALRMVG